MNVEQLEKLLKSKKYKQFKDKFKGDKNEH